MSSDFSCKATQTGFARRVLTGVLLCAISVSSVPPWLRNRLKKQPQRHRGHRDCTEKSDFSCKAILRNKCCAQGVYSCKYISGGISNAEAWNSTVDCNPDFRDRRRPTVATKASPAFGNCSGRPLLRRQ